MREEDTPPYDAKPRANLAPGFTVIPVVVKEMKDGYAVAVFEAIARHANASGEAWPSVATLCELTGWSKKIVLPAIERLVHAGAILKHKRQLHGMDQSNRYEIPAYVQVSPTAPPVVPTVTLGGSYGDLGCHPQHHELEPIELEKDTSAKAKKSLPTNGVAQQIVAAYCLVARIEAPALYGKAVGQAGLLAKAGVTPEEIPDLYEYVAGWAKGADLGTLLSQVDKWRSSKHRTVTPTAADKLTNWDAVAAGGSGRWQG